MAAGGDLEVSIPTGPWQSLNAAVCGRRPANNEARRQAMSFSISRLSVLRPTASGRLADRFASGAARRLRRAGAHPRAGQAAAAGQIELRSSARHSVGTPGVGKTRWRGSSLG